MSVFGIVGSLQFFNHTCRILAEAAYDHCFAGEHTRARRLQLVFGRMAGPSVNPLPYQSELMMEAADTNVTLHFSIQLRIAGKSPQLMVCSK